VRLLVTQADVTDDVADAIAETLEWFDGEPLRAEAFIDRLCDTYGGDDFDLESYDNDAARLIMRMARSMRREADV
jgi:hypothetical protein